MAYRILIVEDQSEVRRLLRSGVETLGPEMEVVDVPSGEEALLEASRRPVDLLIADVRLAGISGLDLKGKFQARNPGMKVILITGLSDPGIRQRVASAGADAYFFKPVDMADLLDAVSRCLGLPCASLPDLEQVEKPAGLLETISSLRQELDAISIYLLDRQGRLLLQSGGPLDAAIESSLLSSFLGLSSYSEKFSQVLGSQGPKALFCFFGTEYDLYLSHLGSYHLLWAATCMASDPQYLGRVNSCLQRAMETLLPHLEKVESTFKTYGELPEFLTRRIPGTESKKSAAELNEIFKLGREKHLKPEDVDAFWESLVEDGESGGVPDSNVLTYEQARKLGLVPD